MFYVNLAEPLLHDGSDSWCACATGRVLVWHGGDE